MHSLYNINSKRARVQRFLRKGTSGLHKRIRSFLVILQTKYKDNKVENSKFLFILDTKRYKQADK